MGWDPVALIRSKPLGSGSTAYRNDGLNGLFVIEVTLIDQMNKNLCLKRSLIL